MAGDYLDLKGFGHNQYSHILRVIKVKITFSQLKCIELVEWRIAGRKEGPRQGNFEIKNQVRIK